MFVGSTGGTPAARVVYLADGTKVSSLGSDAAGLVYRGSFVYRRTADGAQSVESVAHDEGRMLAVQGASGTEFIDTWHVRGESRYARWTIPDPLADKYHNTSPYAFCNNNPVNFVDPFGMDCYSTIEEIEDENGKKSQVTRYHWTEAKSQEELYGLGIEGTYLGEAVVVFNGYYDERLGKDGKLTGEGAKVASVSIYGINGSDDIKSYHGLSVSSNPDKYPMLVDGEYKLFHQQMAKSVYGKGSLTYRVSDIRGNLELNPVGGYNKATKTTTMTEIFSTVQTVMEEQNTPQ